MTTKRKVQPKDDVQSGKSQQKSNNWRGFVNIDLTDATKTTAMEIAGNPLDLMRAIEELLGNGYKLSLSWSEGLDCFLSTATGTDLSATDEGLAVTARSSNIERVIAACYVKLAVVSGYELNKLWNGQVVAQVDL